MKLYGKTWIDARRYFGFTLLALLSILSLAALWIELTKGLSPYRTGMAMSTAQSGVGWTGSTKARMFEE